MWCPQAVWSQLANFAVQDRQDERVLSNQLSQMGLQSIKVVAVTGNIDAPIGSETANLGNFGVVANLNEVRHAMPNLFGQLAASHLWLRLLLFT